MVANTQEKYYDMLRSQIINQTEKTNEINILQDLIGDKAANDFSYFLSNFINFMLIIQTKKTDFCWKYRNWNYCYNNMFDLINNVILIYKNRIRKIIMIAIMQKLWLL